MARSPATGGLETPASRGRRSGHDHSFSKAPTENRELFFFFSLSGSPDCEPSPHGDRYRAEGGGMAVIPNTLSRTPAASLLAAFRFRKSIQCPGALIHYLQRPEEEANTQPASLPPPDYHPNPRGEGGSNVFGPGAPTTVSIPCIFLH